MVQLTLSCFSVTLLPPLWFCKSAVPTVALWLCCPIVALLLHCGSVAPLSFCWKRFRTIGTLKPCWGKRTIVKQQNHNVATELNCGNTTTLWQQNHIVATELSWKLLAMIEWVVAAVVELSFHLEKHWGVAVLLDIMCHHGNGLP